jgi:hypothetical protein
MRFAILLPAIMLYGNVSAQVRKIPVESTIQNITVFSSGARIERTASVSVLPGKSELNFTSLSNQLDPKTVQLKADANITLLSVQSTKDFLSERKIDQEEKSFIDRINTLKDKIDSDLKWLDVFKNEEAMLIKNQAIGGTSGVKALELKDALDLQRQRLSEVYQKQLEIQKRISEEQSESEKFKSQMREIVNRQHKVD